MRGLFNENSEIQKGLCQWIHAERAGIPVAPSFVINLIVRRRSGAWQMSKALRARKPSTFIDRRRAARRAPGFKSRKKEKLIEGLSKSELVQKYEMKVKMIAAKMAINLPASVLFEDLVSVGFIGLMDAADKFDPSKGARFGTYVEFRIRGAILDELRNQDWISRSARDSIKEIEEVCRKYERETGENPSDEQASKEMGITAERFRRIKSRGSLSLVNFSHSSEVESAEGIEFQGVEQREEFNPDSEAQRLDTRAFLERLFEALSEDARLVLRCYYFRGLNIKEISQIMEVSESRVSQIHTRSILELKNQFPADIDCMSAVFTMLLDA